MYLKHLKKNGKLRGPNLNHIICSSFNYSPCFSGIIHSDLKPSNFLLRHGNLKLIDFGISKAIQQDKTSIITDTQVGTLNYMSPESIREHCGYTEEDAQKPVFKVPIK